MRTVTQSPGSDSGPRTRWSFFSPLLSSASRCHSWAISARNALRRGSIVPRASSRHRAANCRYVRERCIFFPTLRMKPASAGVVPNWQDCHNFRASCSPNSEPVGFVQLPIILAAAWNFRFHFRCRFQSRFAQFFHKAPRRRPNSAPFVSRIKRTVGVGAGLWRSVPSSSRSRDLFGRSAASNVAAMPI